MPPDEAPGEPTALRRRRRAVGPPGAAPSGGSRLRVLVEPGEPDPQDAAARDEELRRDVPPHHGD